LHELYGVWVHIICLKLYEIHISGIFLETAWRVMNYRQTTHQFCVNFGFLKRNPLAAQP